MKTNPILEGLDGLASHFFGGVGEEALGLAQRALGIAFPPSYLEFLETRGCGWISFQEILGLGGPEHLDVVRIATELRAPHLRFRLSAHLVPILADGYGNYECIDTSRPESQGECPVVVWNHEGAGIEPATAIAESFESWLQGLVRQIREVEKGDASGSPA